MRPKLKFNSNLPPFASIADIIHGKVLAKYDGGNSISGQSVFIERQAKQKGIKTLAASMIGRYLLTPMKKGKSILLSYEYCNGLVELLKAASQEFNLDKADMQAVTAFEDFVQNHYRQESQREATGVARPAKTLSYLAYLHGTDWVAFERIGDSAAFKDASWGYSIGKLNFRLEGMDIMTTMDYPYEHDKVRSYKGPATTDGLRGYLFLDLFVNNSASGQRANMVLRLAESDVENQTLLMGHFTYHSTVYKHLLTKTIILLRSDVAEKVTEQKSTGILSQQIDLDGDQNQASTEPKNVNQKVLWEVKEYRSKEDRSYIDRFIPPSIKKFIYSRDRNRLSFPKERQSSIADLEQFLIEHRESKLSYKLVEMCGDYYVYYVRDGNSYIRRDSLRIAKDTDEIEIQAQYSHTTDTNEKLKKKWQGQVFHNLKKEAISVEFTNEKSLKGKEAEDPILLIFWIPGLRVAYSDAECFPGIIAGFEDASLGPISLACLIVRKGLKDFNYDNDARLSSFFEKAKLGGLEIAPKSPVFMLANL